MSTQPWSRRVRLTICAVFAVALLAGLTAYSATGATGTDVPQAATVLAVPANPAAPLNAEQAYVQGNTALAPYTENRAAAMQLLPAYRYSTHMGYLEDQLSPTDALGKNLASGFASGMFALSSALWQLTLMLLQWALTIDPLADLAGQVNKMIAGLTNGLWESGLIVLALGAMMFALVKRVLAGKMTGVFSVVLLALVPLAAMQVLATRASNENPEAPATGSPLWLATTGSGMINNAVGDGLGVLSRTMSDFDTSLQSAGGGNGTDCEAYFDQMYGKFAGARSVAAAKDGKGSNIGETVFVRGESGTMILVSRMWYEAMYIPWQTAQFGNANNSNYANHVSCRFLEMRRQTPTPEQFAIVGGGNVSAQGAGDDAVYVGNLPNGAVATGPFSGFATMPFVQTRGVPGDQRDMYGLILPWAACSIDGGSQMSAGFRALGGDQNPASATAGYINRETGRKACSSWRASNAPVLGLSPSDQRQGYRQFTSTANEEGTFVPQDGPDTEKITDGLDNGRVKDANPPAGEAQDPAAMREDLLNVRDLYRSMQGHSMAQKLTGGVLAVIGAIVYGWTLLGLAVGTIVAQFSFAIMLALLPLSLFLAAFARNNPKGNPGVRMLKMTATFGLTKVMLVAILTLFIVVTVFIRDVVAGVAEGFSGDVMTLASPLLAFFLLHSLLKKIGFGNIMSPTGAASLTTQAVATLSGEKQAGQTFSDGVAKTGDVAMGAASMALGGAAGVWEGAQRRRDRGPTPGDVGAPAGGSGKPPEPQKDTNALTDAATGTPLTEADGTPVVDAHGAPILLPPGATPATDADGNLLRGSDGLPLIVPAGQGVARDADGNPLRGPDGLPLFVPAGMTVAHGPDGQVLYDNNGNPQLVEALSDPRPLPGLAEGLRRASSSALDQAIRTAMENDTGNRASALDAKYTLAGIGSDDGLPYQPNVQGGLGLPQPADPNSVNWDRLAGRGAVATDAAVLADGIVAGALSAQGVDVDGKLTNLDADGQFSNASTYAEATGLASHDVLPSPVVELAPLANAAKLVDGEVHIPVVYDATNQVSPELSLNAAGIGVMLNQELRDALAATAQKVAVSADISLDAATYLATLNAGSALGMVDGAGNVANIASLFAGQMGSISDALAAAAKDGLTTVALPVATPQIDPEAFAAAVAAGTSRMAPRLSRDPVPNATAWARDAGVAVSHASTNAKALIDTDPGASHGAALSKLDDTLGELNSGLQAVAVAVAATAVSDSYANPQDGPAIQQSSEKELDRVSQRLAELIADLNAKGATAANDNSASAIADLNASINGALKEYQRMMEDKMEAIRASHDKAAKAIAAERLAGVAVAGGDAFVE